VWRYHSGTSSDRCRPGWSRAEAACRCARAVLHLFYAQHGSGSDHTCANTVSCLENLAASNNGKIKPAVTGRSAFPVAHDHELMQRSGRCRYDNAALSYSCGLQLCAAASAGLPVEVLAVEGATGGVHAGMNPLPAFTPEVRHVNSPGAASGALGTEVVLAGIDARMQQHCQRLESIERVARKMSKKVAAISQAPRSQRGKACAGAAVEGEVDEGNTNRDAEDLLSSDDELSQAVSKQKRTRKNNLTEEERRTRRCGKAGVVGRDACRVLSAPVAIFRALASRRR
jgi:hypothetical protein